MVVSTILNVDILAGNQVYPPLVELSCAIPAVSNLLVTLFAHLCGVKKKKKNRSRGILLANIQPLKEQRSHLRLVL